MPIDKKWIILIVPVLLIILLLIIYNEKDKNSLTIDVEQLSDHVETKEEDVQYEINDNILVDLKGEVYNPGVYEMKDGDRVIDVIERAGGLTKKADESQVNLAQRLFDEMVIIVPKLLDDSENATFVQSESSAEGAKIRINQASKEELMTLPGIGEQKALSIIQYREEHGPFRTKEDLLNISGIGEKTLERFADQITVP